jgi:hypothetical protein
MPADETLVPPASIRWSLIGIDRPARNASPRLVRVWASNAIVTYAVAGPGPELAVPANEATAVSYPGSAGSSAPPLPVGIQLPSPSWSAYVNAGLPSGSPNTPVTDPAAGCGCPRLPVVGAFLVSAGQLHPVAGSGSV